MAFKVDLKKHFRKTYQALPKKFQGLPLYVAVSSGLDSSVLAHLLLSLRKELSLPVRNFRWLHVNYHLRVPDSDQEEVFLKKWAEQEKVPILVKSLCPPSQKNNFQNWAREQRYRFFVQAIQKESQRKGLLLTAHHQLDQVETILTRILTGSGLKALKGMEIFEEAHHWSKKNQAPLKIFRPFLKVPQEALKIYAKYHKVKFCQDESNQSPKYFRNRLRHEVWPKILEENPQAATALTQIGLRAASAYDALEPAARRWLKKHQILAKQGKGGSLPGPELAQLPFGKRQIVLELFFKQFFTKTRNLGKSLQAIEECLDQKQIQHRLPLTQGFEWVWSPSQLLIRKRRK